MIPVNDPLITVEDVDAVTRVVQSGWISSAGPEIEAFEREFATFCGVRHGVSVSNGTTALQAAVLALDAAPGSEVILPSFTIISCALSVVEAGLTPVLVDIDPRTGGMDAAQVAAKVTTNTAAIMPVHLYGHSCDMDPLLTLAERHGIAIIEDAAEVHAAEYLSRRGTTPRWRRCGSMGTMATFSFYANKLITTGEGGMVVTDSDALAERLRSLRNLCFQRQRRFLHSELGYNFRLTNMQAALGLSQLRRIDSIVARKRQIGERYNRNLEGLKNATLPVLEDWCRPVYWVYGLMMRDGRDAASVMAELADRGVDCRPYFLGMHEQPAFHKRGLFVGERYPVSEAWARNGFYIPAGVGIGDDQIDQVSQIVWDVVG